MGVVRERRTPDLRPFELAAIRALLDAAFAHDFSDDDWAHALGGTHVTIEDASGVIAHGAVVGRPLDVGPIRLEVGYVEAVAVRPDRQHAGIGTAVMRALGAIVARDYALGVLSTGEWGFYERLGWERWRGPTSVRHSDGRLEPTPDDDDSLMVLQKPGSLVIDPAWPMTCDARPGDPW
jgi:aminoglycoside 2'-N-acetyltransferase I